MAAMRIGEVAKRTGIGIETIRFYERQGLLVEPERQSWTAFDDRAAARHRGLIEQLHDARYGQHHHDAGRFDQRQLIEQLDQIFGHEFAHHLANADVTFVEAQVDAFA